MDSLNPVVLEKKIEVTDDSQRQGTVAVVSTDRQRRKQTRGGDTEENEDGSRQEMATLWVVLKKTKTEADKRRQHWVVLKRTKTEAVKRRRHWVVLKKMKTEADKRRRH